MSKKVIVSARYCEDVEYHSIKHLTEVTLDGEDYEMGTIEIIEATASNNSGAIGILLENLLDKGIIQLSDIRSIIGFGKDVTLERKEND